MKFELTDEQLMGALRGLPENVQRALTRTRWKDGIDVDDPNHNYRKLSNNLLATLPERAVADHIAEVERLRSALQHLLDHTELKGSACKLLAVGKAQAALVPHPQAEQEGQG